MKILPKYILREWLQTLVYMTMIICSLLLLEDVYKNFQSFIKTGIKLSVVGHYCFWIIVANFPVSMLAGAFLSTLLVFGRFHRHNEITAFRSVGMSMWKFSKYVLVACGVIGVLCLFLETFTIPIALNHIHAVRLESDRREGASVFDRNIGFVNERDRRLWFIKHYNLLTNEVTDMTMSQFSRDWKEMWRVVAREGYFDQNLQCWVLKFGHITYLEAEKNSATKTESFIQRPFPELTEPYSMMALSQKKPREMTLKDLWLTKKYLSQGSDFNKISVQFHRKLANLFKPLLMVAFILPFLCQGTRVNPVINITKAIGFLVIFFIISQVLCALGNGNILLPSLAVWSPMAILASIILVLFKKAS